MLVEKMIKDKIEALSDEQKILSALHPDHRADLARSGLQAETIKALGIHSVPSFEIHTHLGSYDSRITSLLCFPYPDVEGFCRDKVFPPVQDRDGHTVRYLQRKNSGALKLRGSLLMLP